MIASGYAKTYKYIDGQQGAYTGMDTAAKENTVIRSNFSSMESNGGSGWRCGDVVIFGCTFTNNNVRDYGDMHASAYKTFHEPVRLFDSCLIKDNNCHGIWADTDYFKPPVGYVPTWRNCIVDNNRYGLISEVSQGIHMYNNLLINNYTGIAIEESEDCMVYNNTIISSQGGYGLYCRYSSRLTPPISTYYGSTREVYFRNNHFYNNLVITTGTGVGMNIRPDALNITNNYSDYNCYMNLGSRSVYWGRTVEEHNAMGFDQHSIITNAGVIYPAIEGYGLALSVGSPCIGAGTNLPYSYFDFAGAERSNYGNVDIGAFEFGNLASATTPLIWVTPNNHDIPNDSLVVTGGLNHAAGDMVDVYLLTETTNQLSPTVTYENYSWSVETGDMVSEATNTLQVVLTGAYGGSMTNLIQVYKGGIGTGYPGAYPTNPPTQVLTGAVTVSGTNSQHVVGKQSWTVMSRDNLIGSGEFTATGVDWNLIIPDVDMALGPNTVTILSTNLWGVVNTITMGIEYGNTMNHYADPDTLNPVYPYATLETAAPIAQWAVDAAADGDTVWLAEGTYSNGKTDYVNGLHVTGSRIMIEKGITLRGIGAREDAIITGNAVNVTDGSIRGITLYHEDANVYDLTFADGGAVLYGGCGMLVLRANTISNCVFRDNATVNGYNGAAVDFTWAPEFLFTDCLISNNTSITTVPAALRSRSHAGTIRNVEICNNTCPDGAVVALMEDLDAYNLIIHDNTAKYGVFMDSGGYLFNSTIVDNNTPDGGLIFGNRYGYDPMYDSYVYNCIVHNNNDTTISGIGGNTNSYLRHCIVDAVTASQFADISGTVVGDPELASDYTFDTSSLAFDAGTNFYWMDSFLIDYHGNARVQGAAIDIGAIEHQ